MIIRLWRERIPKKFWPAVDLVQDLFVHAYHGNILAEATDRTLRAANAKMGDMAGNSAGRYLAAEKEFDDAFNRAAVQGYIIRD